MANLTLAEIQKKMAVKRKNYLKTASTDREVVMGMDDRLYDWICRNYLYQYKVNGGSVPSLSSPATDYKSMISLITVKDYYEQVCEIYKNHLEVYPNAKEPKKLLDMARLLRRTYARR